MLTNSTSTNVPLAATVIAALGMIPVVFAGGAIGFFVTGAAHDIRHLTITQGLVIQLFAELPLVPYLLWFMRKFWNRSPGELGYRVPSAQQIGIGLLGAVAMIVIVQGLSALIQTVAHVQHTQAPVQLLKAIRNPATLSFFVLFAVVLAPVIEETAFRVFLFNAAHSYWRFWPAAALSGVFFGLAHADPYAFFPLVLGGIVLCKVYDTTKNAWISMISHGIFNGTTILALLALQKAGIQ